jgi:sec-independent protein translocase protein TatA
MNLAAFGNFFGPDSIIIFLVILVFFGAKRLPELARGLGQSIREFQKAKDGLQSPPQPPPSQLT